jgi:hypothetical protein
MINPLNPNILLVITILVVVGYDRVIKGGYWEKSIPRSFISSCCRGGSSMITFSLREGHTRV